MTPKEIDIALAELEERVDRLRALYEQYFMGYEKLEPTVARKEVDRRFAVLRKESIRNTAQRFKFNVITQKFNTYSMYWGRICRQIEEGTYKRHIQKAKKRFGEDSPGARGREKQEASIDVDQTDFEEELEAGGGELDAFDLDKHLDSVLGDADREGAAVAMPEPPSQRAPVAAPKPPPPSFQPYRGAATGSDAAGAPRKQLVRKKDGTLGPITPATPITPVGAPAPAPPAAAAPATPKVPGTPGGRFPAALPVAPGSSPRLPGAPPSNRVPGVPAPAPTPAPPPAAAPRFPAAPPPGAPRLPAAPPPGAPISQRLPAAPPPGAPRLPAAPPPGGPISSPRVPSAPVTPGPTSTGRLPAAPPPGGPRPMIRPAIRPAGGQPPAPRVPPPPGEGEEK